MAEAELDGQAVQQDKDREKIKWLRDRAEEFRQKSVRLSLRVGELDASLEGQKTCLAQLQARCDAGDARAEDDAYTQD